MRHRFEKGASLVEASILLPLLILMAIGLSEVGFLVVDYLTSATRPGKELAPAPPPRTSTTLFRGKTPTI